jgi:translation initiation factor IF-3
MQNNKNSNNQYRVRINFQIKVPQVRVVQSDGSVIGVMPTREALQLAQEQGLDLVEINPKASPPVCKIVDYGKFKYDEKKRLSEVRKKQKIQELKELTFRPTTDENDLQHKLTFAKQFLSDGNKVKFTIRFRGREVTHPQVARDKLNWIIAQLSGLILPNPEISSEGKFMWMIVSPTK